MLHGAKTWIELSRGAVAHNVASLRSFLVPESEFCAVIKANAYGHGQKEMTEIFLDCGVSHFAVDSIDEAEILRAQSEDAVIFILGYTVEERLRDVVRIRAIQTVYDEQTLIELSKWGRVDVPALVSIKIETGLHRQGVGSRGLLSLLDTIRAAGNRIHLVGASSHFANAEEPTDAMNAFQLNHFTKALETMRYAGFSPRYQHIACSAAAMTTPTAQGTLSRFGIASYGLWSSKALKRHVVLGRQNIELRPVLEWKTRIAQVKDVPPGATIGYGGTHCANRPLRLAVLPVGYADGFDRGLSNTGEVLVRGRRCMILGTVCMNMIMVDVSAVPSVGVGDDVILIGKDGMHALTAEDIAAHVGTIHYEIVTRISARLPRVICQ
jgi:alanine racemase